MNQCAYAACNRLADTDADGWPFCSRHLRDHRALMLEDQARAGGQDLHRISGLLLPSSSLAPLLEAANPRQQAVA